MVSLYGGAHVNLIAEVPSRFSVVAYGRAQIGNRSSWTTVYCGETQGTERDYVFPIVYYFQTYASRCKELVPSRMIENL